MGVAPGGIGYGEVLQEFFVAGGFGVEADAENGAAARFDVPLQTIERGSFFDAGLTVRRPEIEYDDFAAVVGKA